MRTTKASDDVDGESVTPDDSGHTETSMSTDSMIESSVNSSMSDLHHTSSSQIHVPHTGTVDQPRQNLINRSYADTVKPEIRMVNVRQSSNRTLPVVQSSIRPTSSVLATPSRTVSATRSSPVVTDGVVVQPQYSRPALTMLVNSEGRRIVVPVVKKHVAQLATPASQAAPASERHPVVSGQVVYGFLQPSETLTASREQTLLAETLPQTTTQELSVASVTRPETLSSLIGGGVEMTQYLTTGVLPERVEYNTCQPVKQPQQGQHR